VLAASSAWFAAEADALSALARSLSEELDPLPSLVRHLQTSGDLV
jgi:hypothetical protein